MLTTLQKTDDTAIVSVPTANKPIDDLLSKEWLLTNNRGGYASSTIIGCNTRRYHGLLIGSLTPPANRVMALAECLEMMIFNGKVFNLSTFEFNDKFAPEGFGYIKRFRRDTGVHFDYQLDRLELTKSVYLLRDTDTVVLVYDFTSVKEPAEFVLRPFVGLRDFHALQKSYAPLKAYLAQNTRSEIQDTAYKIRIRHDTPESCELLLGCSSTDFEKDEQWWFNFTYRNDKQRGQDFTEDLWTPGFFRCHINSPTKVVFWANLRSNDCQLKAGNWQSEIKDWKFLEDLRRHRNIVITAAKTRDKKLGALCLAADQFITKRDRGHVVHDPEHEPLCNTALDRDTKYEPRTTILAGFPWFADWGRDAFISLPGLLLSTGRFNEAKSVLTTFSLAADDGLIPNRFDDNSGTAYFNSIDSSLWFINAAFQYLNATSDSTTFTQQLLPTIRWIIHSYHNGTRFGICADTDGLIAAGNDETQLTWMDAKYDGVAFTPRCGKAVEINALWYNALCLTAQFYLDRDIEIAKHYESMAKKIAVSFCELFWNEKYSYLNDCIPPNGSVDTSLRPNQIFAVSLPFSPLPPQQAKCVVDAVQKNLLTPYGLRTLSKMVPIDFERTSKEEETTDKCVQNSHYKGTYTGPRKQRDEAYHNGTVWPYLIGPFVEAYLKVNDFSRKSKEEAAEFIEPLMQHLTEDGCLGQLCEIFDGDAPHKPRGCVAQAWSIAELIRAYQLINN